MNNKWKNAEGKLTGTAKGTIVAGVVVVLAIASISGLATGKTNSLANPSAATHATATPTPTKTAKPTPTPTPETPKAPDGRSLATASPAGTTLQSSAGDEHFTLQFGQVNWDGDAAIKAANMFNEAPPAGMKYIIVPVTFKNTGTTEVRPGSVLFDLAFVTDDGQTYQNESITVVVPNNTLTGANLYAGTSITGDVTIPVPAATSTGAFAIGGEFVRAN